MITLLLAIIVTLAHAQVRVQGGPYQFHDAETTTQTKTTIIGPQGTRRISSSGNGRLRLLPGYEFRSGREQINVEGAQNTGITLQQRSYYLAPPQAGGIIITETPVVEGGPGSITREHQSETKSLPNLRIGVGR